MRKRVLITGCNGFLGQALWNVLKKTRPGFRFYGLDIKAKRKSPDIFRCDLKDRQKLQSILRQTNPHYIIHCAGGRARSKRQNYRANYLTTKHLLRTVAGIPGFCPRVLIIGSAAEYGKMPLGKRTMHEDCRAKPLSDYGQIKLQQTRLGLRYAQRGYDVIIARLFNIVGKGTPLTLAVGAFAAQVAEIEKSRQSREIRTGNLKGKRDYLDIEDICRALLTVIERGESGKIYNVCSGRVVSMKDLLRMLLSHARVRNITVKEGREKISKSFDMIGSNARLRSLGRWTPRVSVGQSLKRTLQSYRERP